MAKILYIILVLNLFGCSTTQKFYIDKIQESNPTYPNQTYIFPKLNGKNISITRKINSNIIADFLEIDIEKKHQSIFENVWATKENSIPRLSDITYKINTLNSSLYSVSLKAEGCGAYCEYLSTTYNYDLIKGKKILLDDLLSNDGKIKLLKILTIRKKNIIKTHLKLLRDENISENLDAINLFESCLKNTHFESFEYFEFQIKNHEIIIFSDRCSNHAYKAIGYIGDFKFEFSKNKIATFLNDYGKAITQK